MWTSAICSAWTASFFQAGEEVSLDMARSFAQNDAARQGSATHPHLSIWGPISITLRVGMLKNVVGRAALRARNAKSSVRQRKIPSWPSGSRA